MKKVIKENSIFITVLIIAIAFMMIYISKASSNVPIMDYWGFLNVLVEKDFMGGVTFTDLYGNNGVHRTPGELFLFLLNVRFFHWNTQISMYVGTIVMAIYAIILYRGISKVVTSKFKKNVCSIVLVFVIFSLGPFEIITQEFFTSFALRMMFFALGFELCNRYLKERHEEKFDTSILLFGLYNIATICLLGAAYSMAYSGAIIIVCLLDFICKIKQEKKIVNYNNLGIVGGILLADILYLYGINLSLNGSNGSLSDLFTSFIKGFFIVNGASLFGSEVSHKIVYFVGAITILIHLFWFWIYIKNKLFRKSYTPILLYLYFIFFYGMIYISRSGFGIEYLASARYILDSLLAIVADIYIISMLPVFEKKRKIYINVVEVVTMVFITVGIVCANTHEVKIQNYRKAYDDVLITMMKDIDNYTDEELGVFQAGDPQLVRNGVEIMDKYDLGIFRYYDK